MIFEKFILVVFQVILSVFMIANVLYFIEFFVSTPILCFLCSLIIGEVGFLFEKVTKTFNIVFEIVGYVLKKLKNGIPKMKLSVGRRLQASLRMLEYQIPYSV